MVCDPKEERSVKRTLRLGIPKKPGMDPTARGRLPKSRKSRLISPFFSIWLVLNLLFLQRRDDGTAACGRDDSRRSDCRF